MRIQLAVVALILWISLPVSASIIQWDFTTESASISDPGGFFGAPNLSTQVSLTLNTDAVPDADDGTTTIWLNDIPGISSVVIFSDGNAASHSGLSGGSTGWSIENSGSDNVTFLTTLLDPATFTAGSLAGTFFDSGTYSVVLESSSGAALASNSLNDPIDFSEFDTGRFQLAGILRNSAGGEIGRFNYIADIDLSTITTTPVPEPPSLALMVLGLAGLGFSKRR